MQCPTLGPASGGQRLAQDSLGAQNAVLRIAPAQPKQKPLGLTQLGADLAVALCLAGLAGKRGKLSGKLFQHIIDTRQIALGPFQLQLGLMAALIEAGNPGRLFQHAAARLGAGIDQLGNLPLAHQRGRMRTGRGIGEKHLHVARAHILAIQLIGRARVAGDAPCDVERIFVIEPRRGQAFGIVELQHDFGKVARAARGGAGKDHILHPVAAHRGGPVFTHDPAQCLEQVGLAATIGADNTRQTVLNDQVGGVDEAFEAIEA